MIDSEVEEEIKIEYFESDEVDPLCENSKKLTSEDRCSYDFISQDFPDENINQRTPTKVVETSENHESAGNNETDFTEVTENEEPWHKLVDNNGRYLCKFCDNSYSTIQTIRQHVKKKHLDEYSHIKTTTINKIRKRKPKCHICNQRFKNTNDLQEHVQNHEIENVKTFDKETEMLTHLSNKQESIIKKHFCVLCGYSTSKRSHLRQHELTHSRTNQKKCSYCNYRTSYQPNMTVHERIHTNDKPYSCSFNGCNYRCAAKSALYSHQLKHDKVNNMLYCDKCSYNTVYKQSLSKHLDSHIRNSVRTRF